MKAAYIESTGGPEVIRYGDLPDPEPGPRDVLIRVEAVSVNPIDTYVRGGLVAFDLPQPYILGCDAAGVVQAVGDEVTRYAVGDAVWCTNQGLLGRQGTFAERIAVAEDWVYPRPDGVSAEAIAASALVGITAHLGLFREAHLRPGETVLVIGGTGGVGSMVVQMAKAVGAVVLATAGTAEKTKIAEDLGADITIGYYCESIAEATHRVCPDGVHVFWETRRQPDFDLAVQCLAERGRMVLMAGRDARPEFPVGPFYVKECSLHGFVMFKATPDEMRVAAEALNGWMAAGKVRPNIDVRMTLAEAAEAHRIQEAATVQGSGQLRGKIVLTPA